MPVQPDGRPADLLAMPLPKARNKVKCDGCGAEIHPLLFRYLFMSAGWRGKPTSRPHVTSHVTLCGPCGDAAIHAVRPYVPNLLGSRVGVKL